MTAGRPSGIDNVRSHERTPAEDAPFAKLTLRWFNAPRPVVGGGVFVSPLGAHDADREKRSDDRRTPREDRECEEPVLHELSGSDRRADLEAPQRASQGRQ